MLPLQTQYPTSSAWLEIAFFPTFPIKYWSFRMLHTFYCTCRQDLEFLSKNYDSTVLDRLQKVVDAQFQRMSYTRAVEILQEAIRSKKKKFEKKVSYLWQCLCTFLVLNTITWSWLLCLKINAPMSPWFQDIKVILLACWNISRQCDDR